MNMDKESGTFLIPLAFAIVALLGVSFYTIDMALMFKARYDLQVASDAAVTRALSMISANPNLAAQEISQDNIIEMAQLTAIDNLKNSVSAIKYSSWDPVDNPPVEVQIFWEPELEVRATGTMQLDTWLVDKLSLSSGTVVDSFSKGKKKKIAVALVMDLSGSMRDAVPNEQEQCKENKGDDDACVIPSTPKYQYMSNAAIEFIDTFGLYLDGLTVVTFADGASTVFSKDSALSQEEMNTLMTNFASISPSGPDGYRVDGRTNMALALRRARVRLNEIISGPGWDDGFPVIIMISDGAPTVCSAEFPCPCDSTSTRGCGNVGPCSVFGSNAPYMSFIINFADEIRVEDRIPIFSIGVGFPNTDETSPFQEGGDNDALRSFFLRRMANDPDALQDVQFEVGTHCVDMALEEAVANDPNGIYVQSFGSNLSPILNSFGEKILTRLSG